MEEAYNKLEEQFSNLCHVTGNGGLAIASIADRIENPYPEEPPVTLETALAAIRNMQDYNRKNIIAIKAFKEAFVAYRNSR